MLSYNPCDLCVGVGLISFAAAGIIGSLQDPELHSRIDELFWEPHYNEPCECSACSGACPDLEAWCNCHRVARLHVVPTPAHWASLWLFRHYGGSHSNVSPAGLLALCCAAYALTVVQA